jgi:ribonuclease J
MSKKLRIIPIGGLGEVGKNMMVYEYGENILIVDTGIMFPENDMLGIDIYRFQPFAGQGPTVRGIVITHGHEDHISHPARAERSRPVYATQPLAPAGGLARSHG